VLDPDRGHRRHRPGPFAPDLGVGSEIEHDLKALAHDEDTNISSGQALQVVGPYQHTGHNGSSVDRAIQHDPLGKAGVVAHVLQSRSAGAPA
jgi:hypothetical protein